MLQISTPDEIYAELFEAVQSSHVLDDSKTFVDAIPKTDPAVILESFRDRHQEPGFDLSAFVASNFQLPEVGGYEFAADPQRPVRQHIELLWDVLARAADTEDPNSSPFWRSLARSSCCSVHTPEMSVKM